MAIRMTKGGAKAFIKISGANMEALMQAGAETRMAEFQEMNQQAPYIT